MTDEIRTKTYYSIIPAFVKYCDTLSPSEKLFYGEITSLCNEKGYCWASNKYFANLYHTNKRTVNRWLENLKKESFITVEIINENKRKIYLKDEKCHGGMAKMSRGDDKNANHNIKYNTKSNNIKEKENSVKEKEKENRIKKESIEILKILNQNYVHYMKKYHQKNIRGYRAIETHLITIRSRLKAGFTKQQLIDVIGQKLCQWMKDEKKALWIRPSTLFRKSNFDNYFDQLPLEEVNNDK